MVKCSDGFLKITITLRSLQKNIIIHEIDVRYLGLQQYKNIDIRLSITLLRNNPLFLT